jgi:hypothetical protein
MFEEVVLEVQRLTADLQDKTGYSRPEIIDRVRRALLSFNDVKGIASSRLVRYAFRASSSDDATIIDTGIYENVDNITMNYQLELDTSTEEGSIESIAISAGNKQIALISIYWTQEGSTGLPVIDVSFDKDPENGEALRGTFLVDDTRIPTIENGIQIDTSMIVSKSFSMKWSLPANSDYKIKDTMAKIFLVDGNFMMQNQYDLARLTAANILKQQAVKAAKEGQSDTYVEMLKSLADGYISDIAGLVGGKHPVPTSATGTINHDYDRTSYADKAFGKKTKDGEWIAVVGNEITRRTIRYID